MELFKEYTDLVELYDNDPSHPQTQNELINICYLPEFYSRFGLNTDKQKLALSSKHLYTMQVSKDVGYYAEGHSTHYHNLKKKIMLKFPELLITPDFVFYDQSYNDLKEDSLPSSLVAVLPQRFYKINKKTKESFKEVLVAYIEEPMNPSDKTSILTTSFSKHDVERYINRLLKLNRLLYISEDFLNEKKSLSTVYPGIQFTNIATHSNGETRNNMAFLGSLNNNIRQYRENVNLKRMDVSGLYLEHIPENERTKIVCNRAFANNSYAVNYFPEPLREQTYKTKVFETLDKKTIQTIPNDLFIPSLQYFLQNTEQCGHQSKIVYNTLKKRFSENQKDILSQAVNPEKEPDEKEIVKTFETWSEGNLYERLKASPIPQNIQSISDSVLSFENNKSDILDIIGKQFETDSSGKPTLNGMKQLSKAMEIYSDKHYETARYLFIKDGVITRHIAVTSQTPASTIIKPDERFLYQLKNYAEETGSKIVFLHNHPSGYVVPSEADINLTEYLTNFFEEQNGENSFSGHIILDHGTYGLYESENRSWNALINDEIKPLSEVKKNYKIQLTEHKKKADFNRDYTITERSLKELSEYAKACDNGEVWNKKDWIPAFLLTGNGIVTSLEYINTLELQNEDSLSEKLKFLGRKYGSESIIMLPSDKQQFLMCERYAQDTGKVKDVFLQSQDGTFEVSDYRNGNIFNGLRTDEIKLEDTLTNISSVREKIIEEENKRNENKRFNITSPTQIIYHTNSWKDDFPDLISHKIYREVKKTEELENLRLSAKSGDIDAAVELVNKIVNPETIVNLKEKYPDAIICPVIALEKSGTNKLPFAYANYFHENGFEIETHIFQNVKAYHTGANILKRIENRVRFIGEVQKGKDYILIDEHVDFGGTLRDLKDYIETNGGKVVAFSSLTSINQTVRISLSKETIHELEKYGDKLDDTLKYFGVTDNKYGLTENEATGILKLLSNRSRVKELEKGSSKDLGLSLCEIGEEYRKRIKQEEKTRPVYNRFINLISHLSEKELIDYNDSIKEISNKIKSNDTDIIARINHFNKPEFSKKNPAYSEEYLVTKIKEELIYKTSVNKNINNENQYMDKENKTMNKKTIKAFDIYSELKELIGDNNYEALKFATMDYLYNRGIDDAAGYEDSVERNKARFMELPTNIQNVMEKYDDYKIDFDDKALAIKIAGTRNGNLDKAKAQKDEEIANRNYIRESLNLSALNERPMDISVEPEQAEIVENPMEISEDTTEPDPNDSVTSDENGTQLNKILKKLEEKEKIIEKLQKQNQIIMEQNQVNSQKLAALEQQIKAPKEAQEKSANDSMGQDYNNFSSVEHQNLTNQDGFGRDTAYKKNQKVPTFGILQDDGSHQLIKNAVFSKLLVDEENPANNKIELLVLKENGKQEAIQIEEKLYNDIINNVQEFEQRKQGQSKDSWDWMMAHMNYAEKMGTDDNSFRLNTVGNFIHNFRVHCMRDEAHNPEQALKVAGIMFDRMPKREKERFLKMRKQWDKRAKIDGGPTFDEHLIKQFNEFHPKKDINIEQIKGYHFDAEEAVDKQNLMYESLRSGKIEGSNTNIGDTISFAMKYKDTFSGKHLKTPKEDWKIVEVSKCLSGDRALIYNEKSKAYYKIPLENLVEQIRKNERLQTKEEKKAIMQDHKNFGYDGPER